MDPAQPDLEHAVSAIGQLIVLVTSFVFFGYLICYAYKNRDQVWRSAVRKTADLVSRISVWVIVAVTMIIPILRIGFDTLRWWEWAVNALFVVMIWVGLRARRLDSKASENQEQSEAQDDGT